MDTIDLIIIGISLAIILIAGVYHGRGINTFQLYAVGNRKMSDFVITISFIATTYGGSILVSRLNAYYHKGFYVFIMDLASSVNLYLASRFVVLRMKEFMGHFSIAESMGSIYGPVVRITTGFFGIMMSIALLASQFKVGLTIATTLYPELEQFSHYLTVASALLVIIYSTFGGARSVALTDVYQFFLFSICFPILILLSLYSQNPLVDWEKFIATPQFNIEKILTWDETLATTLAYFIWHALFIFDPARIQRFYMSSSLHQAASVFNKSAIIRVMLSLLFLSVSVALHLGGHDIKPGTNVLSYIVNLVYFPGVRGILVAAMIALLMSTADSNLHAASVLFANDIWPIMTKQSNKPSLTILRIASSLIGIVSLFVVLYTNNVTHLLNKTVSFYGPAVTIPLIMSSFGFRPRSLTVLITMGISTAISAYRNYYIKQTVSPQNIFESLVISALILLCIHYFLPKHSNTGWIGIKDYSPLDLQSQATKRWWLRKIYYFQSTFTKSYWKDIFPKSVTTFIALGIYCIIYSSISLFYINQVYMPSYVYWYITIMSIGTVVTLYPAFHSYKQGGHSLLHMLWPILLCIVLFVSGITYMKLSHFSPISFALFIVNIGLSSLLLPCVIIIAMMATAIFVHGWIPPHVSLMDCKEWITTEAIIALTILLSCLVYKYMIDKFNRKLQIITLVRSYEQNYLLTSLHNQSNWNRLDPTYSGKVLQDMANTLEPYVENLPIQEHQKKLYVFSRSLLKRAKEERRFTLDQKSVDKVNIEDLIVKSYEIVRKLDIIPIQFLLKKQTKEKYLLTDPTVFERLFTTSFWHLCESDCTIDHTVYLTISDTFLSYPFSDPYQIDIHDAYEKKLIPPKLPALAFSISTDRDCVNILPTYEVTDEIFSDYLPRTINNLYQEESRQIVQAHGGYIQITETKTSLDCLYILPIDGRKVMRFKRYHTDDLSNKVAETPLSLTQEKELTSLLVSKTALTKNKIEETINFIKKAHGASVRKSGEPYYTHPMEVAKIVLEATNNPDVILSALLHDLVEDTSVTLEQIELLYGFEVSYIVDMVTHYNTYGFRWKLDNAENKTILNKCKDIRVVQIKLADRLHNLRTIFVRNLSSQKRIAKDTIEFYIPWATKNNIALWIPEMENICNKILLCNETSSQNCV